MSLDTENLPPNFQLGNYLIVSRVAMGGMGVIYKALDQSEECVALKVLRPEYAGNPTFVRNFLDEARAVASLKYHPNIVTIHYIGQDQEECTYFSMAFIDGETFDEYIDRRSFFKEADAVWFLQQVVSALDFAQKANIIHLDIKPSNFLIDRERNIFLTDFGLAERLEDIPQQEKVGYGTPLYAAPEQFLRAKTDQRTDIYSLGATLFHLMIGQPPHTGETAVEIATSHLRAPFPLEVALAAGVPLGWVRLLKKMLARKPEDRFADYQQLSAALDELRDLPRTLAQARMVVVTEAVSTGLLEVADDPKVQAVLRHDMGLMMALCDKYRGLCLTWRPEGMVLGFTTVLQAIDWALEMQEIFLKTEIAPESRLWHRIGIHFGEVSLRGNEARGACAIEAAKIPFIALPGGVSISGTVLNLIPDHSKLRVTHEADLVLENGQSVKIYQLHRDAMALRPTTTSSPGKVGKADPSRVDRRHHRQKADYSLLPFATSLLVFLAFIGLAALAPMLPWESIESLFLKK